MDESFHHDELSAEDLAILQAFEKMDFSGWEIGEPITTAHKMKGSAGTIGYITTSTLAHHMEELTKRILNGTVASFVGLHVLTQTMQALETTLNSVVTYNQETTIPLNELETEYKTLDIDIYSNSSSLSSSPPLLGQGVVRVPFNATEENESLSTE